MSDTQNIDHNSPIQKPIVILGARGMLARHLIEELLSRNIPLRLFDRTPGMLGDFERTGALSRPLSQTLSQPQTFSIPIEAFQFRERGEIEGAELAFAIQAADWVINCTAYTAVDQAEEAPLLAASVNSFALFSLARLLENSNAKVIHYSTDYVFSSDVLPNIPRKETDPVSPCGVYGKTKYLGEDLLRIMLPDRHLILRTSWLHGLYGENFIHVMVKLFREKEELRVVSDQVGSPTYAGFVAKVTVDLLSTDFIGTLHVSSGAAVSRLEQAQEIAHQLSSKIKLLPQSTAEAGRKAPRPAYSALSIEKLLTILPQAHLDWKDGIREHLNRIASV
jgi:dTDP-4-dehydrorhamnose reductase